MFTDYLDRGSRHSPDGVCVVRHDGSSGFIYREFVALTHRVALGIRAQGLGPDAKIAVLGPNSPMALACVVGIIRSGASWVSLNPRSETAELSRFIDLVGCDYVLCDEAVADRAELLIEGSECRPLAVSFSGDGPHGAFEGWLGPAGSQAPRPPYRPEDPTMIIGTGGTTGAPKAVCITSRMFMAMCMAFEAHAPEPTPSVYVMATPMTHAAGVTAFPTLGHGGTVVVHDGVVPEAIFDSIERHHATRLFLPPTALYTLLAHPTVRQRDFSSLRHFFYASAPMSADKLAEALEVFGPVMTQTFGQAEAPMICTFMGPDEHAEAVAVPELRGRLASCGRAALNTAVEIMAEDGALLGAGERGEIVVRGDLVMQGYYDNPQATSGTVRPGGWHGTDDIGYRDEQGYFYIVDRKRDMIISGGFNVFPSEVERVIWSHEAVLDCAVIGVPDEKWGEAVTAVVELKRGHDVGERELISLCKQRLGSVQAPKSVRFRELPRSANGKVLKRVLRDEHWAGRERLV